jgi:type II secretory pathway predicted ATPase ExeA
MYIEFYGLKEKPFNLTPSPRFIYMSEGHKEAMALLTYGVTERKGFILLTGEVGTGKTTMIHNLINNLDSSVEHVYLVNPLLSPQEFIDFLAFSSFKKRIHFKSKTDFLLEFQAYLQDCFRHQKIFILIVDEAHKLSFELLEEIRLLSNIEFAEEKLINIFLVGQPELNDNLNSPKGRATLQRIGVRYDIPPLGLKETGEYLEARLAVAGAEKRGEIFQKEAVEAMYRCSQGYPRTINILADNAMLLGYSQNKKTISSSMIEDSYKAMSLDGSFLREYKPQKHINEIEEREEAEISEIRSSRSFMWAVISSSIIILALIAIFFGRSFIPAIDSLIFKHYDKTQNSTSGDNIKTAKQIKGGAVLTENDLHQEEKAAQPAGSVEPKEGRVISPADEIAHSEVLKDLQVFPFKKESITAKKGDTLSDIARQVYDAAGDEELSLLKKYNPEIKDIDLIEVGQNISIPLYTVGVRSCKSFEKADALYQQLKNDGFEVNIISPEPEDKVKSFQVTVGAFKNKKDALSFASKSLEGRRYNMPSD